MSLEYPYTQDHIKQRVGSQKYFIETKIDNSKKCLLRISTPQTFTKDNKNNKWPVTVYNTTVTKITCKQIKIQNSITL